MSNHDLEGAKGGLKKAAGEITGNERLEREGEAQQRKADAEEQASEKEAQAQKARAEAQESELHQRTHQ